MTLEALSSAAVLSFRYYEEFSKLIEESIFGKEAAFQEKEEEFDFDFNFALQKSALESLKEESFGVEL